jgi:hypothetical protein
MVSIETLALLSVIIALMLASFFSWIIYMVFFREKQPTPQQPTPDEKSDQPESEPTEQQVETPTTTTPRKFPIGIIATIIVIAVIAIPLGIIFLSPGDASDKIERGKGAIAKITGKPKIPEIPIAAVIHITDFRGENRIKIGDYAETSINSEGHLIVKTIDKDKSATVYFELSKELQEKEALEIECTVKAITNGKSALGGFIEDNFLQRFTFNGKKIDFFCRKEMKKDPCNPGIKNQQYQVILSRIINDDSIAEFRAKIISALDEKSEKKVTYNLFPEKNLTRIGLDFYSDSSDGKDELEISEIIIRASKN